MPQLDQFTYFSQFVWLTLSFLVYYVVVVHSSLPKLSRILKSRARFLSHQTEMETQDRVNDTLVTDCLAKSAHYLHESVSAAQAWCSSCIGQLKNTDCVKANHSYLKTLSELTLAQVMWKTVRAPISFERILFMRFTQQVSAKSKLKSEIKSESLVTKVTSTQREKRAFQDDQNAKMAKQKHKTNLVVSKNSSASKSKNKGKRK